MRPPLLYTLIFILIYSCSKPESFSDLPVQQISLIPGLNVESSYLIIHNKTSARCYIISF